MLLLDEPTAALDPRAAAAALGARRPPCGRRGGAVVFATQHLEEVERSPTGSRALRDGRLVFAGSVSDYDRSQSDTLFA